jgi:hypothetical protein
VHGLSEEMQRIAKATRDWCQTPILRADFRRSIEKKPKKPPVRKRRLERLKKLVSDTILWKNDV